MDGSPRRFRRRLGGVVIAVVGLVALTVEPAGGQEIEPAADLWVSFTNPFGGWTGQENRAVQVVVANNGEIPAEDVAVTFEAPPGWTVLETSGLDAAEADCAIAVDLLSVTCSWDDEVPAGLGKAYFVTVRSPAGPDSPGVATVSATTTTPEHDVYANSFSATLPHRETPPVPAITVTPTTDLVDGDELAVDVVDFPIGRGIGAAQCVAGLLSLAGCDMDAAVYPTTDSSGAASFTWTARRYIVNDFGLVDCAVQACAFAVATTDLLTVRSVPLTFVAGPVPAGPLSVTVGDHAYLSADENSAGTVTARIECDAAMDVQLQFNIVQQQGTRSWQGRSTVTDVPCTPGAPVDVISDFMGFMDPGAAQLIVRATSDAHQAIEVGAVEFATASEQTAQLVARLSDPNDTTVLTELIAAFTFRRQHNPIWALEFWRAIFGR